MPVNSGTLLVSVSSVLQKYRSKAFVSERGHWQEVENALRSMRSLLSVYGTVRKHLKNQALAVHSGTFPTHQGPGRLQDQGVCREG